MNRVWFLSLCSLFVACGAKTPAATTPAAVSSAPVVAAPVVDELDKPLPLDARITYGKLDNGLTYYVLPHRKPEKRAQMWLVVNAGSVLEDDDQRGLAHLTEHMAFNGTRRFPEHALTNLLEKSGVRFGADLNASTSFDETVYTLQVPTDNAQLFDSSISVLRDWADGISFDPAEVQKERPVVLEEWRLGQGAQKRLFEKQAPIFFHGSKYAERLPIGKPDIVQYASRETLMRFYHDWYRPDLMAVVAVGDFEAKAVEAKIRAEFASMAAAAKPRERTKVTLPPHAETLVSVETDPEMPGASVALVSKMPHRPEASARDYRRTLSERLFNSMLNERFEEVRRKPDAAFLNASSGMGSITRENDAFRLTAVIKEDEALPALTSLLTELFPGRAPRLHPRRAGARQAQPSAQVRTQREGARQARIDRFRGRNSAQFPAARVHAGAGG
ncbi:MAG: pitrilysin family protein [Polyangiaceae bacterium]